MNKIVLASGSPRRKEILNLVGLTFDVVVSDIEEVMRDDESPLSVAGALAFEKGIDVASKLEAGVIVIASDTIVVKKQILGKPKDENDAFNMLSLLKGDVHSVYTGVCLIKSGTNEKYVEVVETKVFMKNYSDEKIRRYIQTGEVWGKAGAYAIQGYGATLVDHIEGDYFNVVGLPLSKLEDMMKKHFGIEFL